MIGHRYETVWFVLTSIVAGLVFLFLGVESYFCLLLGAAMTYTRFMLID
jgi:hypothetical protein